MSAGACNCSLPHLSTIYKALIPFLGAQEAGQIVSLSALGLLFLFVLYQSLSTGKGDPANDYLRATFNVLAFYLMAVCLWFHPWYHLSLITLVIPLLSKRHQRFALLFGFWVLSQKLCFGPLLVPEILKPRQDKLYRSKPCLHWGSWAFPGCMPCGTCGRINERGTLMMQPENRNALIVVAKHPAPGNTQDPSLSAVEPRAGKRFV